MDKADKTRCDVLEKQGFKTGDIEVPGLRVTLELAEGRYLMDLGVVEDMPALVEDFRARGIMLPDDDSDLVAGMHIGLNVGDYVRASIIAAEQHHPELEIYSRAHEESHAMVHLMGREYVEVMLKNDGFHLDVFAKGEEHGACLCGVYGAYRNGMVDGLRRRMEEEGSENMLSFVDELMASKR